MAARFATLTEKINSSAQLTQNQFPPYLPKKEYFISFIAFVINFITFLLSSLSCRIIKKDDARALRNTSSNFVPHAEKRND